MLRRHHPENGANSYSQAGATSLNVLLHPTATAASGSFGTFYCCNVISYTGSSGPGNHANSKGHNVNRTG